MSIKIILYQNFGLSSFSLLFLIEITSKNMEKPLKEKIKIISSVLLIVLILIYIEYLIHF
jgi:sulfite exporter TauE/SafE